MTNLYRALFVAIAVLHVATACNLTQAYESVLDVHCSTCASIKNQTTCMSHSECDWSYHQGCRYSNRVTAYSDLLSESEHYAKIEYLLNVGKACSLHHSYDSCLADVNCKWKASKVEGADFLTKIKSGGTHANCYMVDEVFFAILLGFVDGSPVSDLTALIDSNKACKEICPPYPEDQQDSSNCTKSECKKFNAEFLAHESIGGGQFPCGYDDGRCNLKTMEFVYLKVAQLSKEEGWINGTLEWLRCAFSSPGPNGTDCNKTDPVCEYHKDDDECRYPEDYEAESDGNAPLNEEFTKVNKRCKNESISNVTCIADTECEWHPPDDDDDDDGECKLGKGDTGFVGWMINHASQGKLKWVQDFLYSFQECEQLIKDCEDPQSCLTICVANPKCDYSTLVSTSSKNILEEHECVPHFQNVIPQALDDAPECANAISKAIHAGIACELNLNETTCLDTSSHYGHYKCVWKCDICYPAIQYFPDIAPVTQSPTSSPTPPTVNSSTATTSSTTVASTTTTTSTSSTTVASPTTTTSTTTSTTTINNFALVMVPILMLLSM